MSWNRQHNTYVFSIILQFIFFITIMSWEGGLKSTLDSNWNLYSTLISMISFEIHRYRVSETFGDHLQFLDIKFLPLWFLFYVGFNHMSYIVENRDVKEYLSTRLLLSHTDHWLKFSKLITHFSRQIWHH